LKDVDLTPNETFTEKKISDFDKKTDISLINKEKDKKKGGKQQM
jgi:hypothetical protein